MFEFDLPMVLFLLIAGHALADYPLQGSFLAQAKNRNTEIGKTFWPWALPAHGLVHGSFVAVITGVWWLGLAETIAHSGIDYLKCEQKIGLHTDQLLHLGCKLLWFALMVIVI